tara:strand:- start:2778 stop:3083 length:306 start_codon:yes stop_codon:yes gene_type:complete
LERIAFGQLGMSVDEFYDILPKHLWSKIDGFYELENMRCKQEWEMVRWQTTLLLNIQLPKNKSIKPQDLIEFDWDEKKKGVDFDKLKTKAEYFKKMESHGK